MATNNAVNTPLSGTTGTGNFVGANSPTLITPIIGAATATSVVFSPTTGGIIGTTTNDNTGAGKVGELISSTIALASAVSFSNNTPRDITSISLTAGDWDVFGNIYFGVGGVCTIQACWASLTSATLPDNSLFNEVSNATGLQSCGINVPFFRASLSTTTTVYLSGQTAFSTSTVTGCGGIFARRRR